MAATYSVYNTREANGVFAPSKIPGIAVTGTNTYYSEPIGPRQSGGFGFHFEWNGTPTGTFTMWRTNKPNPDVTSDTDWIPVSTFAPTNPAGAAGKYGDDVTFTNFYRYRFKYVNASGSGNLFCWTSQPSQ